MSTLPGQIVYFGDSLTDNGNLYAFGQEVLDQAVVDAIAGPTGAVSDGPTHAQYTADATGIATQNYAVASAEVDGTQTLGDLVAANGLESALIVPEDDPALSTDINLASQVDRFLADNAGADLGQTTAFIWIGGNDYGAIDTGSASLAEAVLAKMEAIAIGIASDAFRLSDAGISNIMIATLPSATFFAVSGGFSPQETALANSVLTAHNLYLSGLVEALVNTGIDAELFDVRAITDAIVDDPTGFGLIAPYGQTQLDSNVLDTYDADQVAFYDDIHPSTATHGVLGAFNARAFSGAEIVQGNWHADLHWLGDTDDFATGLGGSDRLRGEGGDDVLIGGTGRDNLAGHRDDDVLSGGQDGDILRGGHGNDILGGGWGDDQIFGGGGNDVLIDGLGSDQSFGRRGDDTFIFTEAGLIGGTSGADIDIVDGGEGADRLIVVLSTARYTAWSAELESVTPEAVLAALGISAISVESIVAIQERDGLSAFANESWYDSADLWGLV